MKKKLNNCLRYFCQQLQMNPIHSNILYYSNELEKDWQRSILLKTVILLMQNRHQKYLQNFQSSSKTNSPTKNRYNNSHSLPHKQNKQETSNIKDSPIDLNEQPSEQSRQLTITNPERMQLTHALHEISFKHHCIDNCLCSQCNCGRHLCKLESIKPDLKKSSVYQNLFKYKKPLQSVVIITKEVEPLIANHLQLSTIYGKDFQDRQKQRLERPKPIDGLRFQGPAQAITTYSSFFPGHKGKNQYIKPTNKHKIGEFPLLGKTVYSIEYKSKTAAKDDYLRLHDSLKTGNNWFGQTTYKSAFNTPNADNYLPKVKQVVKASKSLSYSHQFQTNYHSEYTEKLSPICPSKAYFQKQLSQMDRSKYLYRQNTDFKSMSPNFKPFATSKITFT